MQTDRFWKVLAAAFVIGLFYVGSAVHRLAGGAGVAFEQTAAAGVIAPGLTQDAEQVLITSSADGRSLYVWTFGPWNLNERRVPQFSRQINGPGAKATRVPN